MRYTFAKEKGFNETDYEIVYEGKIKTNDIAPFDLRLALEDLFYTFNMDRPKDFKGHSMSVSDIVELNGKKYYCDSFGFKEIA